MKTITETDSVVVVKIEERDIGKYLVLSPSQKEIYEAFDLEPAKGKKIG